MFASLDGTACRATARLSLPHIFLGPLLRRIYKDELEIIPENGKNFLRPVIRLSIDDLKRCGEETAQGPPVQGDDGVSVFYAPRVFAQNSSRSLLVTMPSRELPLTTATADWPLPKSV